MGQPGAKQGDRVMGTDIHIVMIASPGGPIPTPLPHLFAGQLDGALSSDVTFDGKPAATQGSTATNAPAHVPQGGPFQSPPANKGEVLLGSATVKVKVKVKVKVNGKPVARNGDKAMTCNDPADLPAGTVIAVGTVMVGG